MSTTNRTIKQLGAPKKLGVPVTLLTAALLLSACGAAASAANESRSAEVTRGTVAATVNATGNIQPNEEVKLAFASTGTVVTVNVKLGASVKRGDVLASLDVADHELALAKARVALKNAEAALIIANANYSRTIEGPRAADITAARSALAAAQDNYAQVAAGKDPADYASAEARLRNTEAALRRAQSAYDLRFQIDPAGIGASAESLQLEQATNDYNAAKAELDRAAKPATKADLSAAQQRIADARAALDKAQTGVKTYDVQRAEAERAQAQTQIEQARLDIQQNERRIAQARLIAPIDGVVSALDVKAGEAAPTLPVVTLVDLSRLITDINVDEVDIAKVREGQDVTVRLDSLPGVDLNGTVARISPTSKLVNGVVSYSVRVAIPTGEAALRPGMTANTRIVLEKRDSVLVVPNWALRRDRDSGKTFLTLPAAGDATATAETATREVEVTLGLKDDTNAEILSGASEGQKVLEPKPAQ